MHSPVNSDALVGKHEESRSRNIANLCVQLVGSLTGSCHTQYHQF